MLSPYLDAEVNNRHNGQPCNRVPFSWFTNTLPSSRELLTTQNTHYKDEKFPRQQENESMNPPPAFVYTTEGFNGYAVKYSPFYDTRLAVASAANYGLVGNGRLYILSLGPGGVRPEKW